MPKANMIKAEEIDALLPQTQCGLCTYNGCMPYAKAIAQNQAEINLCPPGGVNGLKSLAALLGKDATPFIADMEQKTKPALRAVIREAECIGCTKCITACPVDAIIGSGKLMHSIITDECNGCELCIAPCPVDCIDMVATEDTTPRAAQYRQRYHAKQQRMQQEKSHTRLIAAKTDNSLDAKKAYLAAALLRAQQKK
jgi:electron transport complex protein RnfB